jgi:hypothetical protein
MPKPLTTIDLLAKLDTEGGIACCWRWLGAKTSFGHGIFSRYCKHQLAHRWFYEFFHNEKVPNDLIVRHLCDNPSCCNPTHLLIGTQRENVQDAYNRHRRVHPWKISRDVLAQIYTLKEQGLMNKDIAARLNISRQVVSKYLRFKKEVPQDWRCLLDQLLCLEK